MLDSGHQDFSQSTEEIAPLTAEERKAHLEQLQEKLKEKRSKQAVQEKEEAKRNELNISSLLRLTTHD
jgi:UBX domain-containing protein 1/4